MGEKENWEVIVIGGGPAGSTVARYMLKEGVRYWLLMGEILSELPYNVES